MERNYAKRKASEFNAFRRFFQLLWVYLVGAPLFHIFYRIEIHGKENIPKGQRFICAGNHISYLDPFILSYAVNKPIAFMAKKELFEESTFQRVCMDWLGAFAVNREKLEVSTIKTVKEVFKSDWFLGIFPEGGIRRNRTIEKVNKGFAVISKAAKWNILPIAITGCEEYNWIPFKGKLVVKIGTPISHELSQDEIMEHWAKQVAELNNYKYIQTESDNMEAQDQKEFSEV